MNEPDHELAVKTCETLLKNTPDSDEGNLAICHKEALDSLEKIETALDKVIDERDALRSFIRSVAYQQCSDSCRLMSESESCDHQRAQGVIDSIEGFPSYDDANANA